VCTAQKQVTPVANQICVVRSTGAVDSTCRDSVYNVFLEHCQFMTALWPAAVPFGGIPLGGYKFQAQNDPNQDGRWHVFDDLLVKYKVPLDRDPDKIDASAQDANEQLLKARLGEIAATRRLDDDVSWAQKLIVAANSTAAEWAPKCPICEPACVHLVQKYAVDYATAAHPYGLIGDESVTEGPAKTSMLDGMAAAIATDKKCPTIAEAAKMKIKTTPLDQPSAGSTDATPKGHSIALKAVVTVGAAAAIYSAVQFARQKPNVIVDQSKKLIAKVRK
jgi:hypothetical protein